MEWQQTGADSLLIHLENAGDVEEMLALMGEAGPTESEQSYDLRMKLHELKNNATVHAQQASLFDEDNKPEAVHASVPAPSATPWSGTTAQDWALAHTSAEVTKEWDAGYSAGWRGDEIVTLKSPLYLLAYEQGRTARESHNERFPAADGNR